MNAQRAAIAIREHGEIATRLGGFDDAKGEFLPGNGNVGGVIASELEKDAGVRATLVSLAGGMEKARAEAEAGSGFFGVAHLVADGLERFLVGVVHTEVVEEGEIVCDADA